MEDFGYKKTSDQQEMPGLAKRVLLACATVFSLAIFVYITISAYYFVHQDKEADIETVKSPEEPIKIIAEEESGGEGMQVDHAIYEDIFGNKKAAAKQRDVKIRLHPEPALPPTKEKESTQKSAQKVIVYSTDKKDDTKEVFARGEEKRDNSAPEPKPKSKGKKKVRVQIAAMSSRDSAEDHWHRLTRLYSSIFSDLEPFIERVDLGKRGIFYRLQVGNFPDQISAERFCSRYVAQARKSSADCIIVE